MKFLTINQPFHKFGGLWRPTETQSVIASYFKYKNIEDPHAMRILSGNEIYFQNPLNFQDHEDCQIVLRYSQLSRREMRIIAGRNRYVSDGAKMSNIEFEEYFKRHFAEIKRQGIVGDRRLTQYEANKIGVFCMTPQPDNSYMWNEYAHNRTGFCVELDATKLFAFITSLRQGIYPECVIYSDRQPLIDLTSDTNENWDKLLCTKKTFFAPEEECRLILYGILQAGRAIILEDGILRSVTLGQNMGTETRQKIKEILSERLRTGLPTRILLYEAYSEADVIMRKEVGY